MNNYGDAYTLIKIDSQVKDSELAIVDSEFRNLRDISIDADVQSVTIKNPIFSNITQENTHFFTLSSDIDSQSFNFQNTTIEYLIFFWIHCKPIRGITISDSGLNEGTSFIRFNSSAIEISFDDFSLNDAVIMESCHFFSFATPNSDNGNSLVVADAVFENITEVESSSSTSQTGNSGLIFHMPKRINVTLSNVHIKDILLKSIYLLVLLL